MWLTQMQDEVFPVQLSTWTLLLAAGVIAGLPLVGCSTEPDDGLNDTSQPPSAAFALQTSNPTPSSPPPSQPQASKGSTAEVIITFNHAPRVTNMLSDLGRLDVGDQAQLGVAADDPDGDRLSYEWETKCEGTFDRPTSPAPTFTLAAIPFSGACDLVVRVKDGKGGENHGTLTLSAGASPPIVVADGPGS